MPDLSSPSNNDVTVIGDVSGGDVYGGFSFINSTVASATFSNNNTVIISGSDVTYSVYGGYSEVLNNGNATANNSTVIVSYSNATDYVGGMSVVFNGNATTVNNNVTVSHSNAIYGTTGGYSYVDNVGNATTNNNTVTVRDSNVGEYIAGGISLVCYSTCTSSEGNATANYNTVTVSRSNVEDVIGGSSFVSNDGNAIANSNTVTVSDTNVSIDIYGGSSEVVDDGDAIANYNSVAVSHSNVTEGVYGGFSNVSGSGDAIANFNFVTLEGNTEIGGDVMGGGGSASGSGTDLFTGNTLNVRTPKAGGIAVGGDVSNFEFYNFLFQSDAADGTVGLDLSGGTASLYGQAAGTTKSSSIQNIDVLGGGMAMSVGQSLTLVQGTVDDASFTQSAAHGRKGATLLYDYALDSSNGLIATVTGVQINPQAKALSEAYLAGSALINQGSEALADLGIRNAVQAALSADSGSMALSGFAGIMGGKTRVNSGSHVDVTGFSLITGLSLGQTLSPGRLTLGAFFEYGTGDYDTYNSFANFATVRGGGDTEYLGGGILGRLDFNRSNSGQLYAEASVRFGRVETDYRSADILNVAGGAVGYESSRNYFGLHAGLGYILDLAGQADLELYGKYFWTRQAGDSVTLKGSGDPVSFKAVGSHRIRLGSRLSAQICDSVKPFAGLAWEHEFDGRA
jgi:hypothetical protein